MDERHHGREPHDFPVIPSLAPLPQIDRLRRVAARLWAQSEVIALWLGGSLARGQADLYSDVDLRIAVTPEALDLWRELDLQPLFEGECVDSQLLFGNGHFLRPVVLSDGDIFDLWIESSKDDPPEDATLVLACRDPEFEAKLRRAALPELPEPVIPEPAEIRQQIVDFWIGSLKHRKVLHRGLNLLSLTGLESERGYLTRLWYLLATCRYVRSARLTIHIGTPIFRAIEGLLGPKALALLGAPARNGVEIRRVIEEHRDEVSRAGRILAERLGFDYPDMLEKTVRRVWQELLAVEELSDARET